MLNPSFGSGGDIFHENKPSRDTLVKAIRIFRKYVLSDRPVALRVLNNEDRPFQVRRGTSLGLFPPGAAGLGLAARFCCRGTASGARLPKSQHRLQNANGLVNYADPNLNVGLPVFTIHGNHDDPSGIIRVYHQLREPFGS